MRVRRPASEVFEKVGALIALKNAPGPLSRLEARITPSGDAEEQHRLVIYATDDALNPIPDYRGTVSLSAEGDVYDLPVSIEMGPDGRAFVGGITFHDKAPVRIKVGDERQELTAVSGPAGEVGEYKHYFGGIHFHTRLSVDGDRDPQAAYAYARDYLNLDVVSMTDHAPIGAGWDECLAVNEAFYELGRFVTITAWESSNAYGHANLYLRTPEADGGTWYWNPDVCPSQVDWNRDVVMVPHHPNCGQPIEFEHGQHRAVMGKQFYWSKYTIVTTPTSGHDW